MRTFYKTSEKSQNFLKFLTFFYKFYKFYILDFNEMLAREKSINLNID